MCLTVMTLDNSKHCHLEQILFSLELSRYQGLTVFIRGILDKGKFKVQMECFFLFLNLKEQPKSGRSPFTVS